MKTITKKITLMLFAMTLVLSFVGCSDSKKKKNNEASITREDSEVKNTEINTETVTVQEETTTTSEKYYYETIENDEIYVQTLEKYKDYINSSFNNIEINPGDILDAKENMQKAGLDIAEYADLYSITYYKLCQVDFPYTNIEIDSDCIVWPVIDDETNYVTRYDGDVTMIFSYEFLDDGTIKYIWREK